MAFHLFNFSFSLSLSLSLSRSFLSSFLSFFFYFLFASSFCSLSFFFCLLCFCFMKTNNIKRFNCKVFISSILCLFLVSCLVFSFISLFLIFVFFPGFQLCFLFNINVFGFKKSCNKTVFLITCVLQNAKSYRFFCAFFGQVLVDVQKHYKNRYFSTFPKAKTKKK